MHLHVHISASKQRHTHVTRYMHKTHNSTLIHTQSLYTLLTPTHKYIVSKSQSHLHSVIFLHITDGWLTRLVNIILQLLLILPNKHIKPK